MRMYKRIMGRVVVASHAKTPSANKNHQLKNGECVSNIIVIIAVRNICVLNAHTVMMLAGMIVHKWTDAIVVALAVTSNAIDYPVLTIRLLQFVTSVREWDGSRKRDGLRKSQKRRRQMIGMQTCCCLASQRIMHEIEKHRTETIGAQQFTFQVL